MVAWATAHGYLNGATLTAVMTTMQTDGFPLNSEIHDGPYLSVNWTNAAILQSAIHSHGPVKIGVGAEDFQSNPHGVVTPGTSGWAMYDYPKNQPEDHCVSLCGYGIFGIGRSVHPASCDRPCAARNAHGSLLCGVHVEFHRDHRSAVDAEYDL